MKTLWINKKLCITNCKTANAAKHVKWNTTQSRTQWTLVSSWVVGPKTFFVWHNVK